MRRFDIVALGEPLVEFNQQADGRYRSGFGGDTSNMVMAASRLGGRTGYLTHVGDDRFGQALLDLWAREGVDVTGVRVVQQAPTGLYFVHHDAQGHHFEYRRAGSAASLMGPADVPVELIAEASWLHVSAISQAISANAAAAVDAALAAARTVGTRISYDTNLRLRLWPLERARPVILASIGGVDLAKTSIDDAQSLLGACTPEAVARDFLDRGAKAVAVTLGAEGAFVADATGNHFMEAIAVDAVDATGAGDAFTGALVLELHRGVPLVTAARFASAAAALATTGYGAVDPLPTRAQVMARL
jgi:2-dehydro-3-deoxygluconokinase